MLTNIVCVRNECFFNLSPVLLNVRKFRPPFLTSEFDVCFTRVYFLIYHVFESGERLDTCELLEKKNFYASSSSVDLQRGSQLLLVVRVMVKGVWSVFQNHFYLSKFDTVDCSQLRNKYFVYRRKFFLSKMSEKIYLFWRQIGKIPTEKVI